MSGVRAARPIVVAIDGPAGSGKSSVSRAVAARLGYDYLDTGAAYRAVAWQGLAVHADLGDASAVEALLERLLHRGDIAISTDPLQDRVKVGETDVTTAIRLPEVSAAVSSVARVPAVRERLNAWFRELIAAAEPGIVVEGRDITTVVAPDAGVRLLLTASPEVRAARRAAELGEAASATVGAAIASRDAQDSRVVDFMTAAPGVATVDSTGLDFGETVEAIVALVGRATD